MTVKNASREFVIDALLCDSAVVAEGKLFVQGAGWNGIFAQQLPARHPRVGLAIALSVPYTATNKQHTMVIRMVGEDGEALPMAVGPEGQPVMNIDAGFNMGRPPLLHPGDSQIACFALNMDAIEFSTPGGYAFTFDIDGEEVHRLSFRVTVVGQPNIG